MAVTSRDPAPVARTPVSDAPGTRIHRGIIHNPLRAGPIVVAIHGDESSQSVLAAAHRLARRLDLALRVVTVVEYEAVHLRGLNFTTVPDWVERELGVPRREALRHRLREFFGGDEEWTLEVRYGSTDREIQRCAEETHATLIVVDASPRQRLRRTVAGLRALRILRRAPCPVLSVADGHDELPRHIVAAVDFSPASVCAAQGALLLAGDGATLALAHVPFPVPLDRPLRDSSGALLSGDVAAAFDRLTSELDRYAPPGLIVEPVTLNGRIAESIMSHAEAMNADLIVTGTHGPNVVERFFVGSVATELLHLAKCSVLASPAPPRPEYLRLELLIYDVAEHRLDADWKAVLAEVTRRNAGRLVSLTVSATELGTDMRADEQILHGIDYDPVNQRVRINVGGGPAGTHAVTSVISGVRLISVSSTPGSNVRTIRLTRGATEIRIDFLD